LKPKRPGSEATSIDTIEDLKEFERSCIEAFTCASTRAHPAFRRAFGAPLTAEEEALADEG
jgi:hypothetical protein